MVYDLNQHSITEVSLRT